MQIEDVIRALRQKSYRITRSRRAVIRVVTRAENWMRPEEVHSHAQRECPSLGLVTVYRTLALLSELGFVRRVHMQDGCHGYAPAALGHGHHLICRHCNQVVEFAGDESIDTLIEPVERQTGFLVEEHMLELVGLCPDCQTATA